MSAHLEFWGAVDGVTGSMHVLEFEGMRVLMDCGMFQGRRSASREKNLKFGFDPEAIHSLVLSHAHIDHSGNIPSLAKRGFDGPIYATRATQDLCAAMLRDSAKIQEHDAAFLNKRKSRRGQPPIEPLYTMDDAERALCQIHGLAYGRTFHILRHLRCTFFDAGHILGSAVSLLEMGSGDSAVRLVFTGDLGRTNAPILRDPQVPPGGADFLIMESTYGDKCHVPVEDTQRQLLEAISPTLARGGKVIVPCFSVGRTQEMIYHLRQLWKSDQVPRVPVYVDSPLSMNVTEVFRQHPECYDRETRDLLLEDGSRDPFGFDALTYTRSVLESKAINAVAMPCVVISASGMCEAGRILHHLRNTVEDPKNTILITGYMAAHTLGRRLVERAPEVKIFGEPHRLRAEVRVINSLSAHADADELFGYAQRMHAERPLKRIFLVHGEDGPQQALADRLQRDLGVETVRPEEGRVHPIRS